MKKKDLIFLIILICILIIFSLPISIWIIKSNASGYKLLSSDLDLNYASSLGNYLSGTIGLLLSAFAVYLIYITFKLQKEELSETKTILRLQKFDQTFFNLAESINFLVEKMYISKQNTAFIRTMTGYKEKTDLTEFSGYEFLRFFKDIFYELYRSIIKIEKSEEPNLSKNLIQFLELENHILEAISERIGTKEDHLKLSYIYLICHNKLESSLGNYFRTIYQCLRLIKKLENDGYIDEAKNYANIFQARFNSWELALLFYNSLSFEKLKELLDHYNFLDNLYIEDLITSEHKQFSKSISKSRNAKLREIVK